MFTLSLILPIYNELTAVDRTLEEVCSFARDHRHWEFIFVDDGSQDGTADRIADWLAAHDEKNVLLLRLPRNVGKGRAVQRGFQAARGELLCFTDGDLPYSLDQVWALERELKTHDIAIGSRNMADSFNVDVARRRKILGSTFNALARRMMDLPHRDTQAGLKGFRRPVAEKLFSRLRNGGFSFDVEILYLARKYRFTVAEIPVRVSTEHNYKTSKIKLMKDSLRMLAGLGKIRANDLAGRYNE